MKKKTILYFLLGLFIAVCCGLFGSTLFGSYTDWVNQHSVFPEYFRNLFYETKDFFPDFALSIGGGQNIYNFAYYGLFSPWLLLSYLFPFISMTDFLTIINIFLIFVTGYLCYIFLKKNNIESKVSLFISILFVLASPFIFHLHRHFMFVNYLPFSFMALLGVQRYFEKHRSTLLTVSVFLLILTSFYYSVGSLFVIVLYGIYYYLKKTSKITFKSFVKDGIQFLIPIFLGVISSCFLLIPTFVTLLGRGGTSSFSLKLLLPNFDLNRILYDNYTIGLTGFFILSIFYLFQTKKKEIIFLTISILLCFFFPIISYLLNGTLYERSKVLISFLPLAFFLEGVAYLKIKKEKTDCKKLWIYLFLTSIFFLFTGYRNILYYLEVFVLGCLITFHQKKYKHYWIEIPMILFSLILCIGINQQEQFITKEYEKTLFSKKDQVLIDEIRKEDPAFYRMNDLNHVDRTMNKVYNKNYYQTSLYSSTSNPYYHDFIYKYSALPHRNNLMQVSVEDIFLQSIMGVKYVVSEDELTGYTKIKEENGTFLYQNNSSLPIGYATTNIMNQNEFEKLSYPYNLEALYYNVVTDKKTSTNYQTKIKEIPFKYELLQKENLDIQKEQDKYHIISKNGNLKIKLEHAPNKIVIITFDLVNDSSCKNGDLSIKINNIQNKLTCKQWIYYNDNHHFKYVLSNNDELEIKFSKGTFDIENIKIYETDSPTNSVDPFEIDTTKTKGDYIEGTISVKEDSMFLLNIPYDKGFKIQVDSKKVNYERANEAFIAFPITKGEHKIVISYEANFKKVGILLSGIGVLGTVLLYVLERRKEDGRSITL